MLMSVPGKDRSTAVLVAHQPAYLPWCGYFSRLLDTERLVVLDHVQFSERGYQHRNSVLKAGGGAQRLTVPVRRRFTPFLAIPAPGPATWAYDPARLAVSRRVLAARGGRVLPLGHDTTAPFWSPPVWAQLSTQAAATATRLATAYDDVAVIAVDTPFAGTGTAHLVRPAERVGGRVRILLALYGTAHLHNHPMPDPARLEWEHQALAAARHPDVHVADIGHALTRHLTSAYDLDPGRFVPWRSSLDLTAEDLRPLPAAQAHAIATAYGVPLDRPIVAIIARTDPTKGVDQLIAALHPLRDQVHLAAIVVPFDGHDPLIDTYRQQITEQGLRATLIPQFTRDLPRALAGLPATRAVACPSRGEALANLPLETALWARCGGPVVVAPALGGFPEQITHGRTGFLYDPGRPGALTTALRQALDLDPTARLRMCRAAHQRVTAERDVVPALTQTLTRLLPPTPPATQ
jgi:glycosyltransferase involved in cell wall biosynthesis